MLLAILVPMGCHVIGEGARDAFGVPLPGPVIGMVLFADILACNGGRPGMNGLLTALLVPLLVISKPDRFRSALTGRCRSGFTTCRRCRNAFQ